MPKILLHKQVCFKHPLDFGVWVGKIYFERLVLTLSEISGKYSNSQGNAAQNTCQTATGNQ